LTICLDDDLCPLHGPEGGKGGAPAVRGHLQTVLQAPPCVLATGVVAERA